MKINEFLQNLQLNWQEKLQKDEWFFAKERDKINNSFTAEESFNAIMEVVFFIQSETNAYLCTELVDILYLLIRKSDTTEIPKGSSKVLQPATDWNYNRYFKKYGISAINFAISENLFLIFDLLRKYGALLDKDSMLYAKQATDISSNMEMEDLVKAQ